MKKQITAIFSFIFIFTGGYVTVFGQLSQGGKPVEIDSSVITSVPVIDIPSVPFEQLLTESGKAESGKLKHLYFANNYSLQTSPELDGKWITDRSAKKIWLLVIRSSGSYSIGLILSRFQLKGEARLFIYNKNKTKILGAFTSANNNPSNILPVSHLPGDCIYIQLEIPSDQKDYGELVIGEAASAYLPVFADNPLKDFRFGLSADCNIDINCQEGDEWQDVKRSVCRILINGNKYCSGILINAADLSKTPYILTAAHCIGSQGEANSAIFYFNYESPSCNGPDGSTANQISGSTLVSTGDTLGESLNRDSLDFSLVRLNVQLPENFRVYYAGWNRSLISAKSTVAIHHPLGDVKKISFDYDPPETSYHRYVPPYYPEYVLNSHWRILEWDIATTEAGSSGCPLFDQDKRVVGLLTGGEADCKSSVNDYFTKFNYSWNYYDEPTRNLHSWLDPLNSGTFSVDGLDFDAHVEILPAENVKVFPTPGTGNYYIQLNRTFSGNGMYSIYNTTGALIQAGSVSQDNVFYFTINDSPAGIYLIRLVFSDRIYTARIMHLPN
jgi:lysyl endopeptidase